MGQMGQGSQNETRRQLWVGVSSGKTRVLTPAVISRQQSRDRLGPAH